MLENEAALRTWRLDREADAGGIIDAPPLADHRLAYLDYEGPVSGGRGSVARWDHGGYRILAESTRIVEVMLQGNRLKGRAVLALRHPGGWSFEWFPAIVNGGDSS